MTGVPQRWAEQALYDIETARSMLESERYLYVLFCCQQALEKALKATIAWRTQQFPPRIHNLTRLAEVAGLKLDPVQADFLAELSAYYIQTRYPEDTGATASQVNRPLAEEVLQKSEAMVEWVLSTLK